MEKKPKKYEIDTLEKLINVASLENIERFSIDFFLWLHYTLDLIDKLRKEDPEGTKGKSNSEILQSIFIWIDDGKNELKHCQVKNPITGEVHEIQLRQLKEKDGEADPI